MTIATANPRELARTKTAELLTAIYEGSSALVVDSPPGAGKTSLGLSMSATAWGHLGESVMVASWTNRQAIDFASRLAKTYSRVPVTLFIKDSNQLLIPDELWKLSNFGVVSAAANVPSQGVVISNASKWTASPILHSFDWLFIDEAYQIPEFKFRRLAPLAARYVLVGDPGQIPPLIQADVSPWGCDGDGPHVPAPLAVRARHPEVTVANLPVSWRLPYDTTDLVRDAFYDFNFETGDSDRTRRLVLRQRNASTVDEALSALASPETSYVAALLDDDKVATDVDLELAEFVADAVVGILDREGRVFDEGKGAERILTPADIGVVTAHRAQVAEIDKRLRIRGVATGEGAVVVETTERWQGLEREVMVVHHPLAGLESLSSFDLERGRWCVMLSRHKTACLIVGREGIEYSLQNHPHEGERFPGAVDEEYLGWNAHRQVWQLLEGKGRVVRVSGSA